MFELRKTILRISVTAVFPSLFAFPLAGWAQSTSCFNYVVAQDGSGNFTDVQSAFNAVPANSSTRTVIYVKNGTYQQPLTLASNKTNVTLIGQSETGVVLTYNRDANSIDPSTGVTYGTSGSSSTYIDAPGFYANNLTFQNSSTIAHDPSLAIYINGDKEVFVNCQFLGPDDTIYGDRCRQYFQNCYIAGNTDFIFGPSTAVFQSCELHSHGGVALTAASTENYVTYGYVFLGCKVTTDPGVMIDLGRPWRPYADVAYLNCNLGSVINPPGWDDWNNTANDATVRFAEYQNTSTNAVNRVSYDTILTASQAASFTTLNVLKTTYADPPGTDNWDPSVVINSTVLSCGATSTPTRTATATPSRTLTNTPTKTNTPQPPTATFTRTNTPVPPTPTFTSTPTKTNTSAATFTPTSTASFTPMKTETPVPPTATSSFTSTATSSFTPTRTNTPVPPTFTSTATNTPMLTPTNTLSPTGTSIPTGTATSTAIPPTNTSTPSLTSSRTSTPIPPTSTDTATASRTNTPVPPTSTSTASSTASWTPTAIPATSTNTAVPPTSTPVPLTSTPTATPTSTPVPPTGTPTSVPPTPSFTSTAVPPTATSTPTSVPPTSTSTASTTPSRTDTAAPPTSTNTAVPPSATFTPTSIPPTATHTQTAVPPTNTSTPMPPTLTFTSTPTIVPPTATDSATPTASPTGTATFAETLTPTPSGEATVVVFPNPAMGPGPVTLQFTLKTSVSKAEILLFTSSFRLINQINLSNVPAGMTNVAVPLMDRQGSALADGLYYLVVRTPQGQFLTKLLVLR